MLKVYLARDGAFLGNSVSNPMHDDIVDSELGIGAKLRARRTEKGMTLEAVAEDLKIQKSYVSAMERMQKSALPPLGYVLGYVRSYAKLLGLDPAQSVSEFKAEIECPRHLGIGNLPHHVPKRAFKLPKGSFAIGTVLACALVVVSWYGMRPPVVTAKPALELQHVEKIAKITPPEPRKNIADMIALKAIGPSFVEVVDKSGNVLISRIMVPGEIFETRRALEPKLSLRDAGAIELYVAGERIGPIGQKGASAKHISLANAAQ